MRLKVNGKEQEVAAPDDMPLLWVLRDLLGLTGTKFGCGMAQCGACTVHVDGRAMRSCVVPAAAVQGRAVTTIEGLSANGLHAVHELGAAQQGDEWSGRAGGAAGGGHRIEGLLLGGGHLVRGDGRHAVLGP